MAAGAIGDLPGRLTVGRFQARGPDATIRAAAFEVEINHDIATGICTMEKTLIILKPDALQRGLAGRIIMRFEEKGFQILAMKAMQISRGLAEKHYGVHKEKPFYPRLLEYITSSPVVVMVLQANNAIAVARKMMGATFGSKAEPGTIRGDFGLSNSFNLIHGSDSPEAASFEIGLYFKPEELLTFERAGERWIYDMSGNTPE
jgi:nucleoside-diphosphate kinase